MKMKKMLAILAALSVLGTTGLTVGAEDTATTTEPAILPRLRRGCFSPPF